MTSEPAIEAFEEQYAARSGTTVERLHRWGMFGAPCDCGDDECEGFQMLHLFDKLQNAGWLIDLIADVDEKFEAGKLRPVRLRESVPRGQQSSTTQG